MKRKTFILIIACIIVLVVGYIIYKQSSRPKIDLETSDYEIMLDQRLQEDASKKSEEGTIKRLPEDIFE